jgi:hypothetical protein
MSESSQGRIKKEELIREKPPRMPAGAMPPEQSEKNIPQEPLQQP